MSVLLFFFIKETYLIKNSFQRKYGSKEKNKNRYDAEDYMLRVHSYWLWVGTCLCNWKVNKKKTFNRLNKKRFIFLSAIFFFSENRYSFVSFSFEVLFSIGFTFNLNSSLRKFFIPVYKIFLSFFFFFHLFFLYLNFIYSHFSPFFFFSSILASS